MSDPQTQAATMAEAACGTLRMARALVESRRHVDLAGLQDAVGRLCAASLDLPPEQGRALRPQLAAVLAELDALARAMQAADGGGFAS
jgi:tRNA U34 5-methylaminomethyl-2-thiouridine-forming methyltransferase MnmC